MVIYVLVAITLLLLVCFFYAMVRNNIVCDYLIARVWNDDKYNGSYDSVLLDPKNYSIIKMVKYIRKHKVK